MPTLSHFRAWESAIRIAYTDNICQIALRDLYAKRKGVGTSKITYDFLQMLRAALCHPLSPITPSDREFIMMEIYAVARGDTGGVARRFVMGPERWGQIFADFLGRRMKKLEAMGIKPEVETFPGRIVCKDLTAQCWAKSYTGTALLAMWERVKRGEERQLSGVDKSPKFIRIVQTVGTGKSRLLDAIGKGMAGITFILKKPGGNSFPPTDTKVYRYLQDAKDHHAPIVPAMALMIGTLMAITDEIEASLRRGDNFVVFLHRLSQKTDFLVDSRKSRLVDETTGKPVTPPRREKFLEAALAYARQAEEYVEDGGDRRGREKRRAEFPGSTELECFSSTPDIWEMHCNLRHRVAHVVSRLRQFNGAESETMSAKTIFIGFDGAEEGLDKIVYQTVEDVYRRMYSLPFWGFFATTIPDDLPTVPLYTCRETGEGYKLPLDILRPTFTTVDFNIESARLLLDPATRKIEEAIPLSAFASVAHMSKFGRAVWSTLADQPAAVVHRTIQSMIRGSPREPIPFQDLNTGELFTVLTSRLHLHVSLDAARTGCAERIVIENLRVMSGQDLVRNYTYTTTGSEPLIADVSTSFLMSPRSAADSTPNWEPALRGLTAMLDRGLLYREPAGRVAARILCLLAHDTALATPSPAPLHFSRPLTARRWLSHLLTPQHTARLAVGPDATRLLNGHLNFTHFTPTASPLTRHSLPRLLPRLLRQHCALALADPDAADAHLLIPVHTAAPDSPVSAHTAAAILVRVCRKYERRPPVLHPEFRDIFGKRPVLLVQLELEPAWWERPQEERACWVPARKGEGTVGVHVAGWDEFACLRTGGLRRVVERLARGGARGAGWGRE